MTTPSAPPAEPLESLSFPRLWARTAQFTLGEPRSISVTADGATVLFVRTGSATERSGQLWAMDAASGTERLLADPAKLLAGGEQLSAKERARRERARESGAGVVAYSTDDAGALAAFALSGRLWLCQVGTGRICEIPVAATVVDPRLDPTGKWIGYLTPDGALRIVGTGGMGRPGGADDLDPAGGPDGADDRPLAKPDGAEVSWGQAEFVAAEEMDRHRGFWWAPDGSGVLAQRTDVSPVPVWMLADPADPVSAPRPHRYPAAGSADALVQLWFLPLDGEPKQIGWDDEAFPYLTRVSWAAGGPPVVQVLSRDQRRGQVFTADPADGSIALRAELAEPIWIELVVGAPALAPNGALVTVRDDVATDTRRVVVDGALLSPAGLQVREVLSVDEAGVLVRGSAADPTSIVVARVGWDGTVTLLTPESGVHQVITAGSTLVHSSSTLDSDGAVVTVHGTSAAHRIRGWSAPPPLHPVPRLLSLGERELRTAVLFPAGHVPGSSRLPVLLAPYGGPHAQLTLSSRRRYLQPQYLADQGFCVVVADGRGTPGRGPAWEKSIRDAFAPITLDDQISALDGVLERYPMDTDADRVGILGWSFGGYLSALAVLARPDRVHAAVAGAPVTDWELYDTYYTERYLGHPVEQPQVYRRNSLIELAGQRLPPGVREPALLILHGMVDDNVVVAHTLRLSSALLAAGRAHAVIPLTGVTHMTPQEIVAENLLRLQVEFLQHALAPRTDPASS